MRRFRTLVPLLILSSCAVSLPQARSSNAIGECVGKQITIEGGRVSLAGLRAGAPISAVSGCVKRRLNWVCKSSCPEATVVARPDRVGTSVGAVLLLADSAAFESAATTWDELVDRLILRFGNPESGSRTLPWKSRSEVVAADVACVLWRDGENNVGLKAAVDAEDLQLSVSVISVAADGGCAP